jgi:hypothetical protein
MSKWDRISGVEELAKGGKMFHMNLLDPLQMDLLIDRSSRSAGVMGG